MRYPRIFIGGTLAGMTPQAPVIDILIAKDGDSFRLYSAPGSWRGGVINRHGDARGDVFPVARPDAEGLERFMFASDAPYDIGARAVAGWRSSRRGGRPCACSCGWRIS